MLKYIITAILIAFLAACSAPKPKHAPSWYTSPPKDFQFFYSVAAGSSIANAKNKAIVNLRKQIATDLDSAFKNKTSKIKIYDELDISQILKQNERLINTMSLSGITIEKTAKFNDQELVLLKLPRKSVFDKFNIIATKRVKNLKENYALLDGKDSWLKQYSILSNCMKDFYKVASIVEAKNIAIKTTNFNEIIFLNNLSQQYIKLKKEISIYALPDMNSRIYLQSVKDALAASGINLSSKQKGEKSLRLFITSETEFVQDYSFNRSKSLVKYTTYDSDKNVVAFRQHTYSAKSRRSYADAKIQTAAHQNSMIKKLGIFDFIGVK
jgi:hypothetical protein